MIFLRTMRIKYMISIFHIFHTPKTQEFILANTLMTLNLFPPVCHEIVFTLAGADFMETELLRKHSQIIRGGSPNVSFPLAIRTL